jgi:hypothetical protein
MGWGTGIAMPRPSLKKVFGCFFQKALLAFAPQTFSYQTRQFSSCAQAAA